MPGKGQVEVGAPTAHQGLPEELSEFLSRDTYSLLIKGESGTGKTILALSILKALQPIENMLYLSTRTSPLQLVENYPWVEEVFGPPSSVEIRGKESEGWETLVDARLDEPNVVFERITNVLMDKQAPTVVIDSWESMSDSMGSEALRTNIKVLQTWRERAGAKFIFIGEDPGNSAIDFMVEGVVVLKDRVMEGRRLREVVLSKLHGIQISRPSYFFTLEGGLFTSFPPYTPRDYSFRNPLPVRFDRPFRRTKGRYPSGYASLDSHLDGGYPSKSTVTVELDRPVDPKVALIFVSRTVQDWLSSGDRVVLPRLHDVEPRFTAQYVKSFGGVYSRSVSVEVEGRTPKASTGRGVRGKRALLVAQAGHGDEEQSSSDLRILIGRPGEFGKLSSDRAAVRLRFTEIDGTLFLRSELPWSGLFAVVPGMTAGNPMIQLEPIV